MSSPPGGRFIFSVSGQNVHLGLNDGTTTPPPPPAGFNIEVFTSPTVTSLPPLDAGFNEGVIDHGGTIFNNYLTGTQLTLFGGAYELKDDASVPRSGPAVIQMGSGDQTVFGAGGDTVLGGSGNQQINAAAQSGAEFIVGGSGNTTIFGGAGDTISGGTGNNYIDGTAGGMRLHAGAFGSDTIFGSSVSGSADFIIGGGANVSILGLGTGDRADLSSEIGNATVNALLGAPTNVGISLGGGASTVFAGATDTINLGSGASQYVDGTAGNVTIAGGGGGNATIFGSSTSGAADSISGGATNLDIQGLGTGDRVELAGTTGNDTINPLLTLAKNVNVLLGQGNATVFGASTDTVTFGGGASQYVDGSAGGMSINGGTASDIAGNQNVVGSSIAGAASGDVISGTFFKLNYNLGGNGTTVGGGDTIDLSASTGNATINAFSNSKGVAQTGVNDSIVASSGSDSIFGGDGDKIGVAANPLGSNTHLWSHGDTAQNTVGSVGFGTFDTVNNGTSYGTSDFTVTGGSGADVTVGGSSVSGLGDFNGSTAPGGDFLFYQNESSAQNAQIVATAQSSTAGGVTSSVIALPDGTQMTLVGVSTTDLAALNAAGTLFK